MMADLAGSSRVLKALGGGHEQQTVRMALATALHHSCGKVHAEYAAPRGGRVRCTERRSTEIERTSPEGAAEHLRGAWAAEE